jgi:hypothetical protein
MKKGKIVSIFNKKVQRTNKFESMEFPSDVEKRDAEEQLLKPASIEPYTGELPKHSSELESRTALIVFRDKQQMDLIGKLFNIRESCAGKAYITNIELLETIAQEVADGDLYVSNGRLYVAPHAVAYQQGISKAAQSIADAVDEEVLQTFLKGNNNDNARDDSEEGA